MFTGDQLARLAVAERQPRPAGRCRARARASFDPARSGDLLVMLKRHVTPIANPSSGYVATHGSPWDYDRRVPILLWRPGARANDRAEAVETVDILPTLAALDRADGRAGEDRRQMPARQCAGDLPRALGD